MTATNPGASLRLPTLLLCLFGLCACPGASRKDEEAVKDPPRAKEAAPAPAPVQSDSVEALVAALDRDADPLHLDSTPAVAALGKLGPRIIPALRQPLLSADETTRLHAQRALEGALNTHFGFVPGKGWTQPGGEQRWRELWAKNGAYDHQAQPADRQRSVDAWLAWHSAQGGR